MATALKMTYQANFGSCDKCAARNGESTMQFGVFETPNPECRGGAQNCKCQTQVSVAEIVKRPIGGETDWLDPSISYDQMATASECECAEVGAEDHSWPCPCLD
jgi:hypothetical protein